MNKYVAFALFVLMASEVTPQSGPPRETKRYRPDYEYNRKTNAFYKLHVESRRRWNLQEVCQVEGAELMAPSTDGDVAQAHGMFKKFPDLGWYLWVADDGLSHESAEEQPLIDLNTSADSRTAPGSPCLVLTRDAKVQTVACWQALPFICKISANDIPYDPHCGVFANDYKYFASVRSCYKIPRIVYTWSEAYSECEAEGAHLVVLNSETEREVVQNLTLTEAKVKGARASWFFFAGFRADMHSPTESRVFKTIFNQTLEQAGFSQWSVNEPNNAYGNEYCGSIFKNDGKLNDVNCAHQYAFICEKEVTNT